MNIVTIIMIILYWGFFVYSLWNREWKRVAIFYLPTMFCAGTVLAWQTGYRLMATRAVIVIVPVIILLFVAMLAWRFIKATWRRSRVMSVVFGASVVLVMAGVVLFLSSNGRGIIGTFQQSSSAFVGQTQALEDCDLVVTRESGLVYYDNLFNSRQPMEDRIPLGISYQITGRSNSGALYEILYRGSTFYIDSSSVDAGICRYAR